MEINFKELIEVINGNILVDNENKAFNEFCIDSRKVEKNNIFVAIKGEKFNPNENVLEVLNKGASIAIIDEICVDIKNANGIIIKVDSCRDALLKLANYYREKLNIKIVGVTGSTGKTSTKDLIAASLSGKYNVFKTEGNFNSDIGMPLMIFKLTSAHDVAVLEMGMSNLGEISVLANVAKPDIAVISNIGLSHIENLKTQENILKAKLEITDCFKEDNILIVNGEDDYLKNLSSKCFKIKKFGYNHEYDVFATNIILKEQSVEFVANTKNSKFEIKLPIPGKHNVLNMLSAISVALSLEVSFEEIEKGLKNLSSTSMRLEILENNNITIINDCYNASVDSMKSALDVIFNYKNKRKVAILGDMYELGEKTKEAHISVGKYANNKVDFLIAIGEQSENFKIGFGEKNVSTFNKKSEFINCINDYIKEDDLILVKASRGMKFEELVNVILKK